MAPNITNNQNLALKPDEGAAKGTKALNFNRDNLGLEALNYQTPQYNPSIVKTRPLFEESVFGNDDRIEITNTTDDPWRRIGFVRMKYPSGQWSGGSGAMISPYHFLTNAHVIFDRDEGGYAFLNRIHITLGQNGDEKYYGEANVTDVHTVQGYTGDLNGDGVADQNTEYDWAILTLDRNIGNFTGWMGLRSRDDDAYFNNLNVYTAGYPGDLATKLYPLNDVLGTGTQEVEMYFASGDIKQVSERELFYNDSLDTFGGQSGSPVWVYDDGRYIVGVHKTGDGGNGFNEAVRIKPYIIDLFNGWKNSDSVPVDKPDFVDYDDWFDTSFASFRNNTLGGLISDDSNGTLDVNVGDSVSLRSVVRNSGTGRTDGGFYLVEPTVNVSFYASTNDIISSGDRKIGETTISAIDPFDWTDVNITETFPNIPEGTYHIGYTFGSIMSEFDSGNNTGIIDGGLINVIHGEDLSGAYFDVSPEPLDAGDSFTIDFQVQNTEVGSTSGFWVDFYLSTNNTIDPDTGFDIQLGSYWVSGLAGNSTTSTLSTSLTLPNQGDAFWSNGDTNYYIGMVVDSSELIAESNEGNNSSTGDSLDYDEILVNNTAIVDDNYEPNNTLEEAYSLVGYEGTWLSNIDGLGKQYDEDWYEINVTPGYENLLVDLTFTHSEGDIDLYLYDDLGNEITNSTDTFDNESLDEIVPGAGTYYLNVNFGNLGNAYDLYWETRPHLDFSDATDKIEHSNYGNGDGYVYRYDLEEGFNYDGVFELEIIGSAYDDTLSGADLYDTLDGGDGIDVLNLDLSDETEDLDVVIDFSSANNQVIVNGTSLAISNFEAFSEIYAGSGNDTLTLDYSDNNSAIEYHRHIEVGIANYIYSEDLDRYQYFYDFEAANITGTDYDDALGTINLDDTLDGGAGVDFFGLELYEETDDLDISVDFNDTSNQVIVNGNPLAVSNFEGFHSLYAGVGYDTLTLDYSNNNSAIEYYSYYLDDYYGFIYSEDWDREQSFFAVEAVNITGTDYNDTLSADSLDDTLDGGDGIDVLNLDLSLETDDLDVVVDFSSSDNQVTVNGTPLAISNFEGFENISTGWGNDIISLSNLDDVNNQSIYGGEENNTDTLIIDFSLLDIGIEQEHDTASQDVSELSPAPEYTYGYFYRTDDLRYLYYEDIEKFQITGTNYADTLNGGAHSDKLWGGADNDVLWGEDGNDRISGGDGDDTINGQADDDTLNGDAGNDSIVGGNGDDRISGGEDDDSIYGGNGKDTISGNEGNDFIKGQKDADLIYGGAGEDSIYGENGADIIWGREDNDLIYGGTDSDTLNGDAGNDTLYGEDGGDRISGQDNDDFIEGGSGDDTIYGGTGKDKLWGQEDNDILYGGRSNDTLNGEDGDDTLYGNENNDLLNGQDGNDSILGGNSSDTIYGGAGNDTLNGETGNDLIFGKEDNDLIFGDAGEDTLNGDNGNDSIEGGESKDFIYGGNGSDTLNGNEDNDFIRGQKDNDLIYGDAGDDTIYGENGEDIIWGKEDNDLIYGGTDSDTLNGDAGNDTLYGEDGHDRLNGQDGNDSIVGGNNSDTIYGGTGDDTLYGNAGNDLILGKADNDWISGGIGEDTLNGDNGNDSIEGGENKDFVYGGNGSDTLYGNEGNDFIRGQKDNDFIYGDAGNDTLYGENGSDRIWGGEDNDSIFGGTDSDTLNGDAGNDTLNGESGGDRLNGQAGNDSIKGGDNDDTIYGGTGFDTLYGDAGSDRIWGREDNDSIFGGSGNDTLYGDAGNDTLTGGTGEDTLYGNAGNDTFVIRSGTTSDRDLIIDFVDGVDNLTLTGGLVFNDLNIYTNGLGTDTILEDSNGNILAVLAGIQDSAISSSDFV